MANDLRVGIVADASTMEPGINAAQAQLDRVAQKTKEISEGTGRAAAAIQAFNKASTGAAESVSVLNAAFDREIASGKSLTEAMEAATASSIAFANSQKEAGAATGRGVAGSLAANGALRTLEGSMMGATRAASSFLSTTLGLGPVLQAAFPVIGAAAIGMILVDIAKGIEKFAEDAEDLGNELGGSWLDGAIAKMTSLGDAIKQADKNADQMAKDRDADRDRQREIAVETATITGGKKAGDTLRAQQLQQDIDSLEKEKVLDLQTKQFYKDKAENPDELNRVGSLGISGEMEAATLGAVAAEQSLAYRVQEKNSLDQYNTALSHQNTLLAEKAKLIKEAEQPDKEKKEKDAYNPYAGLIEDARLYKKLQEDIARGEDEATTAFGKQIDEEAEAVKRADEQEIKAGEEWHRQERVKQEAIAETTQASLRDAEEKQAIAEREIAFRERMGENPRKAVQEKQDVVSAAEDKQLTALDTQQGGIDPKLSKEAARQWQEIEDKKKAISLKAAADRVQIGQQEALQQQQQFQRMFSAMTTPMNGFFDHWLTSGQRMGVAFQRMYDQMAMAVINAEMRMLEKHLAVEMQKRFATLASNTEQTASTIGSNAIKQASDTKTATASISKKAADAAAGAWNALSNIPVVGPVLGAVAAAATFTGIMALAAFEEGTDYVPRTGLAMLHEGERVSTRPENEAISKALSGPKSGGDGDSHFHYSPSISGIDGASVAGMARQHGNVFFRQAYRQMRVMGRAQ